VRKIVTYHRETHPATYIFFFMVFAIAAPLLFYVGVVKAVAPVLKLPSKENFHPTQTIFYDRNGQVLYQTGGGHQPTPVKLNQVPRSLVLATLASEDADFYKHKGVDPQGLSR
jgi:membrane peptidoglycan carboxypeptidase